MEVTKSNFKEILPEVEDAIKSSLFVTIDGEFTGLNNGIAVNPYDTPAQYYDKTRKGAMDFLLIQFGLCAFKFDEETQKFTHQAYNFYIFPKQCHPSASDTKFLCQSSSIDFLISNGFDFNKLYSDGIPYMTNTSYEEQKTKLKNIQKQRSDGSPSRGRIVIPPELAAVVQSTCEAIKEFYMNDSEEREEIEFPKLNAFVRKLIHQEVNAMFPDEKLILDSKALPDKSIVLVARKGLTRDEFEEIKCARELSALEDAVGFTAIISLLSKHSPALVGHNMFLDLCHILNRFCFDLPPDYKEFKSAVTCLFPQLYDTKVMCSQPPLKDLISNSALGPLLEIVQKDPFTSVPCEPGIPGRGYSMTHDKCHEAGYDAYITGLVFLSLLQYLASWSKPRLPFPLPLNSSLLYAARNKLYLMRLVDYPYVNLDSAEPEPDRSHVYVIEFPSDWKTNNLVDLFSKYGPISITWISDTSAFIALHRRAEKKKVYKDLVLRSLAENSSTMYKLMTFNQYSKRKESGVERKISPPHKRKRSISGNTDSAAGTKRAPPPSPPLSSDPNGNHSNALFGGLFGVGSLFNVLVCVVLVLVLWFYPPKDRKF